METPPVIASDAVLVRTKSAGVSHGSNSSEDSFCSSIFNYSTTKVSGYDFNQGINYHALLQTFLTTGFQATNFGLAVEQINDMVHAI